LTESRDHVQKGGKRERNASSAWKNIRTKPEETSSWRNQGWLTAKKRAN